MSTTTSGESHFTIRRKVLSLLGQKFHIYNDRGDLAGYCRQKAFRLKEDIRIFTDESESRELIRIAARSIIDFSAAYDVIESESGQPVGMLRREGLSSLVRDSWTLMDEHQKLIGRIVEDSTAMALARRFVPLANLIPQKFVLQQNEQSAPLATFQSHFNPFVYKITVSIPGHCAVSPLLLLAAGVLLAAIEGRQDQ